jgi:hypothetical protein
VAWLIEIVEEVLRHTGVVTVKRRGNWASRFLEVVVQFEGAWRGFIMLPEGREGRG